MLKFIKRIYPYKKEMAEIIVLRMVSAIAGLLMPYIMSQIVNTGITEQNMDYILQKGALMLALAAGAMIAETLVTFVNTKLTAEFGAELQKDLFTKVMHTPFHSYGKIGTSSLITRCNHDVYMAQELIAQIPYVIVSFPTLFVGGVVLTMMKDVRIGLIMLLISPLILVIVALITRKMRVLWENSDKYIDKQNQLVRERLTGLRVIRAFAKEDFEHERIEDATKKMADNIIRANVLSGVIAPVCMGLLNLLTVLILFLGAKHLQSRNILTVGDIVASIQYIALISNGLLILSWSIILLPHVQVCINRILEVLALPSVKRQDGEEEVLEGSLSVRNLTFSYPGADMPAIENINMEIACGEKVAIIGGTGSGKSTLGKVLMYFFPEWEGEVTLGGKPYRSLSEETVRNNLAVALQKNMIFEGSIEENIKMGKTDASEEELKEVSKIAQLEEFVKSHPEGFSYGLTQGGANISGGQKQRINIARTIIKPASLYIFDDSFSALDFLTERNLRFELNKYLEHKTQIIITQRVATAMHCDKIYVMDNGRIIGEGTHGDLLQTCNVYAEICRSQLGDRQHA